jgi:hypothetical protein
VTIIPSTSVQLHVRHGQLRRNLHVLFCLWVHVRRYRLRDRTRVRPVVPEEIGKDRRQPKSSGIQNYVRGMPSSGGRGATVAVRKSKLYRPSTVVSECGKKMRIFDTDASESGEDVRACPYSMKKM